MPAEEHYRKLERMYLSAPINEYYKPSITISDHRAEITINIHPWMCHVAGAVHGAVYFKMLDDAGCFAAKSVVDDAFLVTSSFNTHLLRPVSKGKLKAVGKLTFSSKNLFVVEAELFDNEGNKLALGTGNFMRSRVALTPQLGYK